MKILKIEKLNYARFRNFCWDPTFNEFCTGVNILFGWNGSGKTTFSKVIRCLDTGIIETNCIFKIKTDLSQINEVSNFSSLSKNVRVFNKDYVDEILQSSPTIPYIFFAGKEAVDYSTKEQELTEIRGELLKITLPTKHDDIAQDTAKLIREVGGINSYRKELTGGATYASYDKTDFEKRINNVDSKIKNNKIKSHKELIRDDINELKNQLINSEHFARINRDIADAAQWILDNIDSINIIFEGKPVQAQSKRIEKLNETQTLWIKDGVSLHFDPKRPLSKCLFCSSEIKNTDELIKHFSNEIVRVINAIDEYLRKIESYTTSFSKLDSLTQVQKVNIDSLRSIFDKLTLVLREKRNSVSIKKNIIKFDNKSIKTMTRVISTNTTTTAYEIETHYVCEQYEAYATAKSKFDNAVTERQTIESKLKKLDDQVRTLKQKMKNTYEPAQTLNRLFETVFPYRKIEITDADDGKGYMLKRDGSNCSFSSLSEGEKNFIALAYFIYSINDVQNMLADDGIVLIDDPVSSLDKQSIFQIFSIIVNEIKKHSNRQYFLLTHNLDFLGHLKQHFRKKIEKSDVRLFSFDVNSAGCVIKGIHPLLQNHRSDYYYVFSVLHEFKDKCDMEDAHLIVNLLRRWLETFLEFKFSTSGDFQSTLESAYTEANKITKEWSPPFGASSLEMYRFVNHGSHGYSDIESIDDSILNNSHLKIQEVFKLIKILDPLHFKKLEAIST